MGMVGGSGLGLGFVEHEQRALTKTVVIFSADVCPGSSIAACDYLAFIAAVGR
jgi:hypothetical protein